MKDTEREDMRRYLDGEGPLKVFPPIERTSLDALLDGCEFRSVNSLVHDPRFEPLDFAFIPERLVVVQLQTLYEDVSWESCSYQMLHRLLRKHAKYNMCDMAALLYFARHLWEKDDFVRIIQPLHDDLALMPCVFRSAKQAITVYHSRADATVFGNWNVLLEER